MIMGFLFAMIRMFWNEIEVVALHGECTQCTDLFTLKWLVYVM